MEDSETSEMPEIPEGHHTPTYEELVQEEAEREIPDDYKPSNSVTETEENAPQVSDFKTAVLTLRPKFKYARINDLVRPAMDSRIFPDNLLDKMKLIVLSLILEYDEGDDIPVADIIFNTQDGLSIGYEGRGIADILEAYGSVREEELEKLAKDL